MPRLPRSPPSAVLGRAPVWVGESLHGFALDAVRELSLPPSDGVVQGLRLVYGSSGDMPHVQIDQAASVADGLTMLVGLRGYTPPQGTMLLAGNMGLLQSNGLVVTIQAHDEATAIDVARLLQPYSG